MIATMTLCASLLFVAATPEAQAKPAAAAQAAPAKAAPFELLPHEESIVRLTNLQRAKHGLPALEVDPDLMRSARQHATWMTNAQRMVHTSQPVAENIAMGQTSGEEAVQSWMNSPGHRANMLNRDHGRIGVAAYRASSGVVFWCQQFRR